MFSDITREAILPNVQTTTAKCMVCKQTCSEIMSRSLRTKPSIGSSVDTRLPRQCSLQSIWTMAMHNVQTTRQSMALSTKGHKAVQKRQSVWLMH